MSDTTYTPITLRVVVTTLTTGTLSLRYTPKNVSYPAVSTANG